MLDPEEFAHYEAWREHKLTTSTDLSVIAYNTEMVALSSAWKSGVLAAFGGEAEGMEVEDVLAANPYNKPGMTGGPSSASRLPTTGTDQERAGE